MAQSCFGYKSKNHFFLFFFSWIAYFSTYVCRLNFSAAMPELQAGEIFSASQMAAVSSVFFIFYGIGQCVSGIIGEHADTRWMVFIGAFVSACSNLALFFTHNYISLCILWAINGIAQSMVWSPILKLASLNFAENERLKFGIDMSTTVPIGTVLSYFISLLTLAFLPWHYVFLTCGLFELCVALIWICGTRKGYITKSPKTETKDAAAPVSAGETMRVLLRSGALLLLIPIIMQGTLKDSVTQWVPSFFSGTFGTSTAFSLALTMLLPIVNVTGAYFAKAVNKRLHNEVATSLVFFAGSLLFLGGLRLFGTRSMPLALLSMAAVTNCMFAVNVMLITLVPLRFSATGRVSTIGGLLNAAAYIGCGALNMAAGKILETTGGWNALFILWFILAVVAIAVSAVCIPLWRRFCRTDG